RRGRPAATPPPTTVMRSARRRRQARGRRRAARVRRWRRRTESPPPTGRVHLRHSCIIGRNDNYAHHRPSAWKRSTFAPEVEHMTESTSNKTGEGEIVSMFHLTRRGWVLVLEPNFRGAITRNGIVESDRGSATFTGPEFGRGHGGGAIVGVLVGEN